MPRNTTTMKAALVIGILMTLIGWQSAQPGAPNEESDWQRVEWRFETDQPLLLETAERPIEKAELPAAALRALQNAAGDNPLGAFEEEIRNERRYYEGEWKTLEGKQEATVTADGVLVDAETDVASEVAPPAVRKTAEKLAGEGQVKYARRSFVFYEVEYVEDGREREILLRPTGERIGVEVSSESAERAGEVD